jgi:Xaa-Pro aminopeptidase
MINNNISKLQDYIKQKRLDCILISGLESTYPDIYYYTEYQDNSTCFLLVTKDDLILYVWDIEKARRNSKIKKIISLNEIKLTDLLKKLSQDKKRIGLQYSLPYKIIKNIKKSLTNIDIIDIEKDIKKLRSIKNLEEIDKIKQACRLTDSIFKYIHSDELKNMNEKQISSLILETMGRKGCSPAFDIIVAGDNSSSEIHHTPKLKKFKENILIDIGIDNKGYKSDMTRTFITSANRKIMDAKSTLIELHNTLNDYIEEGIIISELCNFTENFLEKRGYKNSGYHNFHALGHGVGLETHDSPHISKKNSNILEKNMTIAIEPAIYFPNHFGVRLEDTILIKKKGIERLTKYPLNLN